MVRKRKTETLVTRLRTPILSPHHLFGIDHVSPERLAHKLDAVGEALAYLIEKKHAKLKTKKMSKKIPLK